MWSLLSQDKYKYFQLLKNQSNYKMIMGNNKPLKEKLNKGALALLSASVSDCRLDLICLKPSGTWSPLAQLKCFCVVICGITHLYLILLSRTHHTPATSHDTISVSS